LILFSLFLIDTLIIATLCALTLAFYTFIRSVEKSTLSQEQLPFVSILVPARNEEGKIGRCIESLLRQDYPNFELIVIDDRSVDRTGEIIEEFARRDKRIIYVRGKDAPEGWIGKCNALAHAVGYASGDWFIFTDADTCHKPNSVKDAVSHGISAKADLLSFVPLQELGSFWERLIMPLLLSSFVVGDPFHQVNNPDSKLLAYAYGQYIICRRNSYFAVGGHQSVRDEIVEDHALGRVFKEKGFKILVADGKTLYDVRMYTDLVSLWQGWTKNLYSLIDSSVIFLFVILFLINMSIIVPYLELSIVAAMWLAGEASPGLSILTELTVAQFLMLILWYRLNLQHRSGVNWTSFFMLPGGAIAITVLYLHAAYLVLSGGQVNWKGRRYRVNTSKTIQPINQSNAQSLGTEPTE
jgi:chlorobactene glucosyltransferase